MLFGNCARKLFNLPVNIAVTVVAAYQCFLSPFFSGQCRFQPSCSEYSRKALLQHGLITGLILTIKRIGRCHPFGGFGFDPVPERTKQ